MTDDRLAAENRILDDYLSEPVQDRTTLERYLLLYPMHADALHDLHFSLLQHSEGAAIADQAVDAAWVNTAVARMRQRLDATPKDPFQGLTPAQLTAIREEVGIRAGTLAGFRDRLVDAATVPRRVLQQFAAAIGQGTAEFLAYLALPPKMAANQSFRAQGKPQAPAQKISFAKLMEDANEPDDVRARLLEDHH
jgi:hypothetical protein